MAIQAHLRGVWNEIGGCPHYKRSFDIDRCEMNEMRPCVYETGDSHCELFQEIIKEWEDEINDK